MAVAGAAFTGWLVWSAVPTAPSGAEESQASPEAPATGPSSDDGDSIATLPKNPYSSIVARNPFGLKPEPPPPEPPAPEPPPVSPSSLKLTGITTLLGGKRAMFVVEEPGKTNLVSDLVREGDWDTYITNLQVLSIDERAGSVRVMYGGKELALNFKEHGIKPPTSPLPVPGAPAPGAPGRPGTVPARATTTVAGAPPTLPPAFNMPQPGAIQPGAIGNTPAATGLRQVPSRPSRLGAPSAMVETETPPAFTPEQQVLAMKAQEIIARQQGVVLPPTPPVPGLDFPPAPGAQNVPVPPVPGQ